MSSKPYIFNLYYPPCFNSFIHSSMALQPFVGSDRFFFFIFVVLYTVGIIPWMGDQPAARPLPTHRATQTQNKRTQTYMRRVRFEPTIPVFELSKTFHTFDLAATVIGSWYNYPNNIWLGTQIMGIFVMQFSPLSCNSSLYPHIIFNSLFSTPQSMFPSVQEITCHP
jgi:hypothetical protein